MLERTIDALGVIFGLPALVVAIPGLPFILAQCWDWAVAGRRRRPLRLWHLVSAVAGIGLLLGMTRPGGKLFVVVAALAILAAFARSWRHEVAFLMGLGDGELPGRLEKVLWLLLLIGLAPVGLWLFRYYRLRNWSDPDGSGR